VSCLYELLRVERVHLLWSRNSG